MTRTRDNFYEPTKRALRLRVGYRCSNPQCKTLTVGPSSQPHETINIGEASHITAAAPGGARYDPTITPQERRNISNGIWLCRKCAKIVDDDPNTYSVELLREWKEQSEQDAFIECLQGRTFESSDDIRVSPALDISIQVLEDQIRNAAINDLIAFRRYLKIPDDAVTLRLVCKVDENHFGITNFIGTIRKVRSLGIISPPGTGKTTTLIQLAEAIHNTNCEAAVFVPLGSWSNESCTLLESICRRNAFNNIKQHDLLQLASQDKLTLLLDGWNELDKAARKRAISEIENICRDHPLLKLVISSRHQAMELPFVVYQVEVEPLSFEQQVTIARSIIGDDGERLLDAALRTQGINELLSIPLYFTALIGTSGYGTLPTTKEEILRHFVNYHEKRLPTAEALDTVVLGKHKEILTKLAAEATRTANSSITESTARYVISKTEESLQKAGQILKCPEPKDVLEVLVNNHAVVIPGKELFSFQHQQIQEWYASIEVENVMLASYEGNVNSQKRLLTEILNIPTWEESVLFACERLSRGSEEQKKVVAEVIKKTLHDIDPMFAAEIIYVCIDDVWKYISDDVCQFVKEWHIPGKVDRATRFMITTGRPDFSETIWELLLDINDQEIYSLFRSAQKFRPDVLGPDAKARISALTENIRGVVLSEIISNSGIDGMEFASNLVKHDPSDKIKLNIVSVLHFRRSERLINSILQNASEELWFALASRYEAWEFADPAISARIKRERAEMVQTETDRLRFLVVQINDEGKVSESSSEEMEDIIANADFPIDDTDIAQLLDEVRRCCLETLQRSYQRRLESGLKLPYRCDDVILNAPSVDDGPITELAFNQNEFNERAKYAAAIVGPKTITKILNTFLKVGPLLKSGAKLSEAQKDKYHNLRSWLLHTRESQFIKVWLRRYKQKRPRVIAELVQLLSHHGSQHNSRERLHLSDEQSSRVATILNCWAELLIDDSQASRGHLANIGSAIGRLGRSELLGTLNKLFEEDKRRWAIQHANFIKSKYQNSSSAEVRVSYMLDYRNAFVGLGGQEACTVLESYLTDPEFGIDAAIGLKDIYEQMNGLRENKSWLSVGIDYSEVVIQREENLRGEKRHDCEQAAAIFRAVESLLSDKTYPEEDVRHAIKLATEATYLPHTPRLGMTQKLLESSIPWEAKRHYLSSLVQTGEVVHADMVLAGLKELLDVSKNKTWHLYDDVWKPGLWLEMLPFSDRPFALLEALELIGQSYVMPWKLRGTLRALGYAPDSVAEDILFELAERKPAFYKEHDWSIAVLNRKTSSAYLKFCEVAASNPNIISNLGGHYYETKLVDFIKENPAFRSKLLCLYNDEKYNLNGSIIERTLAKVADVEAILAMINRYTKKKHDFDSNLAIAIESIVFEKCISPDWEGAYVIHGVEATGLRRTLFTLAYSDDPAAQLAATCLNHIDKLRDRYGRIDMEPRHPNVESGLPCVFILA